MILVWLMAIPFIGGFLCWQGERFGRGFPRWVGLITMSIVLGLSIQVDADYFQSEVRVAVERAAVTTGPAGPVAAPLIVTAGGRVELPADAARVPVVAVEPLSAAAMAAALAWRGARVEFTHTTLAEAVARRRPAHISTRRIGWRACCWRPKRRMRHSSSFP